MLLIITDILKIFVYDEEKLYAPKRLDYRDCSGDIGVFEPQIICKVAKASNGY